MTKPPGAPFDGILRLLAEAIADKIIADEIEKNSAAEGEKPPRKVT